MIPMAASTPLVQVPTINPPFHAPERTPVVQMPAHCNPVVGMGTESLVLAMEHMQLVESEELVANKKKEASTALKKKDVLVKVK